MKRVVARHAPLYLRFFFSLMKAQTMLQYVMRAAIYIISCCKNRRRRKSKSASVFDFF
jgi:hypothetical protein